MSSMGIWTGGVAGPLRLTWPRKPVWLAWTHHFARYLALLDPRECRRAGIIDTDMTSGWTMK